MATLIKPDGTKETVVPKDAARGFTLDELYSLVQCETVECIYLANGQTMWLDEEGKLKDVLPAPNQEATRLLAEAGGIPGDIVRGNVLICADKEVL